MLSRRQVLTALLCCLAGLGAQAPLARGAAPTEFQVKAVFVFNFATFVQWPPEQADSSGPFSICLLGADELADHLEDAVSGEQVDGRPLQVRRYRNIEEVDDCRILFIGRGLQGQMGRVLGKVDGRRTLTVSDAEEAARNGVMIQLANEKSRVRLLINVDAAQSAGFTISSNLLRPAEIVRTSR
ncbi:MAG TPA: YfiR family protein [Steroidobacteraceae bacterium]|nr:YfiR family protein [Steroidobacteraceae bacterium]